MGKANTQWVELAQYSHEYEAILVKDILESHEIICVIVNKKDSSYHSFGNYLIFVPSEMCMQAAKIIHEAI